MQEKLETNSNILNNKSICFTLDDLLAATNGKWSEIIPMRQGIPGVATISTDTRNLFENTLFLALRGPRFDGHDFLADAVRKNTLAVCVECLSADQARLLRTHNIPALLVPNSLTALQSLANAHRKHFYDIPFIAVTGSTGKTSTKEIIGAILKQHFRNSILVTHGNTNNQIGVPLNLLKLNDQHRAVVLELGTNSPGEIDILTNIVRPDFALLTNVGPVHLDGLKTLDGVIKEKAQIFSYLKSCGGGAVVPFSLRNHPCIHSKLAQVKTTTFGIEKSADIQMVYQGGDLKSSNFRVYNQDKKKGLNIACNLLGKHQALNATAAIALSKQIGIDDQTIVQALETVNLPGMRMEILWLNKICWINDAYNANPDSMKAFSNWLSTIDWQTSKTNTRYLILGDMLELGDNEDKFHHEVLLNVLENLPNVISMPVGKRMSKAADALGLPSFYAVGDVKAWLFDRLKDGDSVALKGSRGMALEKIIS